jgi:curved DNA-binding protein
MDYKDYYSVLGVAKTAGKADIKKKYRELARKYHPDVNVTDKDAGVKFGEISEAYEVLSDDEKRRKYDAFGSDWEQYQSSGQTGNFDWSKYAAQGGAKDGDPAQDWKDFFGGNTTTSDFFKTIFGQEFRGREGAGFARKGRDLQAELTISLEEAYQGGVKIITVGDKNIRLKLKSGIWDRQRIQIAGKGAQGSGGAANGDLYITFLIEPHPEYRLDGTNLFKDIELGVFPAMLGDTLEVQTISGKFELKIPPGTQNGTVFRLKGRGFPVYDTPGNQGDLFLRVVLRLPEDLTPQEKKLVQELDDLRKVKVAEK